ncbi:MAG: cyclodeaminase/cyclohydrolase family protein [Clostridia bacterium]
MLLQDLNIKDFIAQTASNSPVPGGGSVSALCASLGGALAQMVTALTIGKKKYEQSWQEMEKIGQEMQQAEQEFLQDIDLDSQAFDKVMFALKLPKVTPEEQAFRAGEIEQATKYATEVPLSVARRIVKLFPSCKFVASQGNRNAISDIAVATMLLRTSTLGALYNVKINLAGLPESQYKSEIEEEVKRLEQIAVTSEKEILQIVNL